MSAWFTGYAMSFDLETTGVDVAEDRIITASLIELSPTQIVTKQNWLVNPQISIPPGATEVHGITDEMAAEGQHPREALPWILEHLEIGWRRGLPLIVCNAPYDLTLLSFEAARWGLKMPAIGPVLDPLCLDRALHRYRKGSRKLEALAAHYGVETGQSHSSEADAICAAGVVWQIAQKYKEVALLTIDQMQIYQRQKYAAWATQFQEFRRKEDPTCVIDGSWPIK